MNPTEIGALFTAIGVFVGGLITAFVAALIKWRADQRIDVQYKDARVDKGYEYLVTQLKERVSSLETVLIKTQAEHVDCIKTQEGFRVTTVLQQNQITAQQKQIEEQEKEIALLKDRVNVINNKVGKS